MKKKSKKVAPKKKNAVKKSVKKTSTKKTVAKPKAKKKTQPKAKKKTVKKAVKKVVKQAAKKVVLKKAPPKNKIKVAVTPVQRVTKPAQQKNKKKVENELMEKPGMFVEAEELEIDFPVKADEDVSSEELDLIGDDELSSDMGDDEQLKKRTWEVDMAGEDLDVPGAGDDNAIEEIGAEDEENNPYSIGGDRHDDLDEDKDLGR